MMKPTSPGSRTVSSGTASPYRNVETCSGAPRSRRRSVSLTRRRVQVMPINFLTRDGEYQVRLMIIYEDGIRLLEPSKKAYFLFKQQSPSEKRKSHEVQSVDLAVRGIGSFEKRRLSKREGPKKLRIESS